MQIKIDNKNVMTLGTVQKNIRERMSESEILLVLGSPNMVSNDGGEEGLQVLQLLMQTPVHHKEL